MLDPVTVPRIDLDTKMIGAAEMVLKRTAAGWEARGRTALGSPFDLRFDRIEHVIAFVGAWDGMGSSGGVN